MNTAGKIFSGLGIVAVLALGSAPASAMPGMAGGGAASFAKIDSDGSGAVNKEEFLSAYPNMREQAFDAIDTNADGSITPEEWNAFFVSHAKDTQNHNTNATSGAQSSQGTPQNDGAPTLIQPGSGAGD